MYCFFYIYFLLLSVYSYRRKEFDMLRINCETGDHLKLADMQFFQGNLKKRTQKEIDELKDSLSAEGLMMPFAVWKKPPEQGSEEHKLFLLDGHGRKQALVQLAMEDPDLLAADWPVVYIQANTESDARKALLQITSSYGKITRQGYKQFAVSIPDYKAPSIAKFVPRPAKPVVTNEDVPRSGKRVIKIRVDEAKYAELLNLFKQCGYIEVL